MTSIALFVSALPTNVLVVLGSRLALPAIPSNFRLRRLVRLLRVTWVAVIRFRRSRAGERQWVD